MAVAVNRITNANIYLDGGSMLGKGDELNLPDIAVKMEEHNALGLFGSPEFAAGLDKMNGDIKWNSFYADVMAKVGNPYKFVTLQARSSVSSFNSQGLATEVPLVTILTVSFINNSAGKFQQHKNAEFPSKFTCYYIKQTMDGQDIVEIDILANIWKVNGEDILANYRANVE